LEKFRFRVDTTKESVDLTIAAHKNFPVQSPPKLELDMGHGPTVGKLPAFKTHGKGKIRGQKDKSPQNKNQKDYPPLTS